MIGAIITLIVLGGIAFAVKKWSDRREEVDAMLQERRDADQREHEEKTKQAQTEEPAGTDALDDVE